MTKRTVLRTYQRLLDRVSEEMLDIVKDEFGGGLLGTVARAGVETATRRIQEEMEKQGRIAVEYATAITRGDDTADYERRFLETNPVYRRYEGDHTVELEQHLLTHFREVGADLAPLVASEREDFWLAIRDEYSHQEAKALIDRHFSQAETFKQFQAGVFPSAKVANRVIAVIDEGERRLRDELYKELDRVYEES